MLQYAVSQLPDRFHMDGPRRQHRIRATRNAKSDREKAASTRLSCWPCGRFTKRPYKTPAARNGISLSALALKGRIVMRPLWRGRGIWAEARLRPVNGLRVGIMHVAPVVRTFRETSLQKHRPRETAYVCPHCPCRDAS